MTIHTNQNNIRRLTPRDYEILAFAYHHAQTSAAAIAKRGGYQVHTVRRTLEKLTEAGIVVTKAFVDVYRLGFTQFELCFGIASASQRAAQAFLLKLQQAPQVAWIGAYAGEYQYVITVCCRNPQELVRFIEETTAQGAVSITSRHLAVRAKYTEFPLRSFSDRVKLDKALVFGISGNEKIDLKDHLILAALSEDASVTTRSLSNQLDISQSAVVQRIHSLEKRGIIAGYTYVIDFFNLGYQAFSIMLSTKRHTLDLTNRVMQFARSKRSILYVAESVGAYDYKLGVLLRNPSEILSLAQEISELLGNELEWLTTLTAFDYKKVMRYPFKALPEN
jgi:Lrp/AsnC family leucine-responsive transcriptional regulator